MLLVTCANTQEADAIANTLLNRRLIACAKKSSVTAQFFWQGSIDTAQEIMLIMESRQDLFETIEKEIEQLHSYQTFVLTAIPLAKISKAATLWLKESIN